MNMQTKRVCKRQALMISPARLSTHFHNSSERAGLTKTAWKTFVALVVLETLLHTDGRSPGLPSFSLPLSLCHSESSLAALRSVV